MFYMVSYQTGDFERTTIKKKSQGIESHLTNMELIIFVKFALLAAIGNPVAGKLTMEPRDTYIKVNQSTYFNCSTDHGQTAIFWFHGSKHVFTGISILDPYKDRFNVEKNVWNGTYIYNLVIHSVQPGDAGEYICADDEGVGETYSIQLTVLDNDLDCYSNIQPDGVIGENVFDIKPDEIQLTCAVAYHGNIPPQMEWMKLGQDGSIKDSVTSNVTSEKRIIYTLKLKGDIVLDNSSYVCQTTRSTQNQLLYKCNSGYIKVLYFIGGNTTQQIVVRGAEISCIAVNVSNTLQCTSQWYHGNYTCPLSCDETITTHLLGEYLCTLKCIVRGKDYFYDALKAIVVEPTTLPPTTTESNTTRDIILAVLVSVVVTTLFAIVFMCAFFSWRARKEEIQQKKRAAESHGL